MWRLWKGLRNEYVWLEKVRQFSPARPSASDASASIGRLSEITCARASVQLERSLKSDEEGGKAPGRWSGVGGVDGTLPLGLPTWTEPVIPLEPERSASS